MKTIKSLSLVLTVLFCLRAAGVSAETCITDQTPALTADTSIVPLSAPAARPAMTKESLRKQLGVLRGFNVSKNSPVAKYGYDFVRTGEKESIRLRGGVSELNSSAHAGVQLSVSW